MKFNPIYNVNYIFFRIKKDNNETFLDNPYYIKRIKEDIKNNNIKFSILSTLNPNLNIITFLSISRSLYVDKMFFQEKRKQHHPNTNIFQ